VLKIRLQRRGRKKLPVYKMVVADSRSPRDGKFIEALGQYIPFKEPEVVTLDEARALYWLQNGAQPTDTVKNLLTNQGVMLRLHLLRKGKSDEEIATEIAAWRTKQDAKMARIADKRAKRKSELAAAARAAAKASAVPAPAPQESEAPAEAAAE
jgi:small subunit ribosomal protein S16